MLSLLTQSMHWNKNIQLRIRIKEDFECVRITKEIAVILHS